MPRLRPALALRRGSGVLFRAAAVVLEFLRALNRRLTVQTRQDGGLPVQEFNPDSVEILA